MGFKGKLSKKNFFQMGLHIFFSNNQIKVAGKTNDK
jgi:hypothetical protein